MVAHVVLSVGGIVSYVTLGRPPPGSEWAAPAYLATAGLLALVVTRRPEWPALLGGAAIGWLAELAGVSWGIPFGGYRYTSHLGPALAGVPLVMAAAWMVLLAYVRQWRLPIWAGALVLTALDLVIDPLAAGPLGFWVWERPGPYFGVPLTNYAGWLFVSLALLAWSARWPCTPSVAVRRVGRSVLAFFTILAAWWRMLVPAVAGVGLLAWEIVRSSSEERRSRGNTSPDSLVSPRPPTCAESAPPHPQARYWRALV